MSVSSGAPSEVAEAASLASKAIAVLPAQERNDALTAVHSALVQARESILAANARDIEVAKKAAAEGSLSQAVLKRLDLARPGKYEDMLQGILDVRGLDDPVGQVTLRTQLDDGLDLERVTCPIGVLLIIFEARPEVIANIASLAIKSGNAAILKGGKESTESFVAISNAISAALERTTVPNAAIQLVTTRDVIPELLRLDRHVDLVIPRGSNELVSYIKNNTRIPVLGHADGLCSIYLRADADPEAATNILIDAKLGYTAACNSVETLLVDEAALTTVLPVIAAALTSRGVEFRCDGPSKAALSATLDPAVAATKLKDVVEADYDTEFLDLILAVKTVPQAAVDISNGDDAAAAGSKKEEAAALAATDLAVAHINAHGSKHTDCILTRSEAAARRFQAGVDAACVFWNASTRFADGMRFGFGTEVGISTNKIHSRGPVGLEGLMIYKYLVRGTGQAASEYGDAGGKKFLHRKLPLN